MTVGSIIARADEIGLKTIAITDHIFGEKDLTVIQKIREDFFYTDSNCRVLIGAEVDVDAQSDDGKLVIDSFETLDYIIAGFHFIPTVGVFPKCQEDCPLTGEEFLKVWRNSVLGIVSNPVVDTFAHPGRIAGLSIDLDVHFDDMLAVFAEAAELSVKNNIAWEVNELTALRINSYWRSQWHRIYQVALDAGVKLVYGSDAHCEAGIGRHQFVDSILAKLPENSLSQPNEILS
jgi:histidinol phosphatase-like PHP family hydrolase